MYITFSLKNFRINMHPILLKIGDITIHTYGFFVAMGFLAGILLANSEAKRLGIDHEKLMDLCFYILIAAIVGSRLFYVAINYELFLSNPLDVFKIWSGGLVFYGGFIAALFTSFIYLKMHKMPVWITADIAAPSLAIGHFLGRLGCFSAGCCFGKESDLPWAVTFTHPETLAPIGIPLHPTQLYSSISNLIIFFFLWLFRRRTKFDGQLFWIYVLLYGATRSFIEIFRGDFRGNPVFDLLSVSQTIGISMSVIAVIMLIRISSATKERIED
ncbi:MAG: prolipoprotein diacylglyceryl transferase [Desulfobacterales bacterium]|nr:prolipoprotein diacylglyceryl transferase [Desulfobacterales bacterium]